MIVILLVWVFVRGSLILLREYSAQVPSAPVGITTSDISRIASGVLHDGDGDLDVVFGSGAPAVWFAQAADAGGRP